MSTIHAETASRKKSIFSFVRRQTDTQEVAEAPLSAMRKPGAAKIVRVCCSEGSEVQRLCEMGLVAGCQIRLTQRRRDDDPVMLQIGDSRMCLDQDTARHFWVES